MGTLRRLPNGSYAFIGGFSTLNKGDTDQLTNLVKEKIFKPKKEAVIKEEIKQVIKEEIKNPNDSWKKEDIISWLEKNKTKNKNYSKMKKTDLLKLC
jgi:hypothetical protein